MKIMFLLAFAGTMLAATTGVSAHDVKGELTNLATPAVITSGDGTGQSFNVLGHSITEIMTAEATGGAYYILKIVTPAGAGVPPHVHSREDEIGTIVSGQFEIFIGGKVTKAGPGDTINFAHGTIHGFKVVGTEPGETRWVIVPGTNFQSFFRQFGAFPPGPPDMAKLDKLHTDHGMKMPPPSDPWW
jgi:quercetin dioxygenase-like cupin family protein